MAVAHDARYGVQELWPGKTETDFAYEKLRFQGFCTVDSGLDTATIAGLARDFDAARHAYLERYGADYDLAALGENTVIRMLPALMPSFHALVENEPIKAFLRHVFPAQYALTQANGLINPPNEEQFSQSRWHRDLPYQHFTSSRPLAVNCLFCLDPFTEENGATWVVPGSHKEECFPSQPVLEELAVQVSAPAGTFIVLDSMTYHSGGENRTDRQRRAVNHVYALPLIRRQISFANELKARGTDAEDLDPYLAGDIEYASIDEFLASRQARLTR